MKEIPGIDYIMDKANPVIDSANSYYEIPFYKPEDYFSNLASRNSFIKGVEKLVRTSDRYSKYKNYIMHEVKLNRCEVLKDVTEDDCDIELHHGPVLTLYDYCDIILEYFIMKKWKITSFAIADRVLYEHENNRVQLVMLSTTMHEQAHARGIFINMKQAWGNINAFVDKYGKAFNDDCKERFNRYIDRSMMSDSNDYGILELNEKLYKL